MLGFIAGLAVGLWLMVLVVVLVAIFIDPAAVNAIPGIGFWAMVTSGVAVGMRIVEGRSK